MSGDFGKLPSEQDNLVLRSGMPIIDYLEMQWEMPGRPVWCLTTKVPLTDDDGRSIGIVGFSKDIRIFGRQSHHRLCRPRLPEQLKNLSANCPQKPLQVC